MSNTSKPQLNKLVISIEATISTHATILETLIDIERYFKDRHLNPEFHKLYARNIGEQ